MGKLLGEWPLSLPPYRWTDQHASEHGCHYGFDKTPVVGDWVESYQIDVDDHACQVLKCPYGSVGDRLWVRESFDIESFGSGVAQIRYRADGKRGNSAGVSDHKLPDRCGCVPSIHMPRHCSRITLEVTGVRVERVKDITEEDAKAEGVSNFGFCDYRESFEETWEMLYGNWRANPWVWVIEFKNITEAKK
ncbi:MAG: hypothetical protein AAGJ40_09615 [Planctomycetota bacterium]